MTPPSRKPCRQESSGSKVANFRSALTKFVTVKMVRKYDSQARRQAKINNLMRNASQATNDHGHVNVSLSSDYQRFSPISRPLIASSSGTRKRRTPAGCDHFNASYCCDDDHDAEPDDDHDDDHDAELEVKRQRCDDASGDIRPFDEAFLGGNARPIVKKKFVRSPRNLL